ncbi:MAG: plastocyanin/azurin family copper-binding protein [Anaerolineaceae bacterium]
MAGSCSTRSSPRWNRSTATRLRILFFVPALLVLSVAAACGNDEGSKATTSGSSPSPSRPSANAAGRNLITIQIGDNTFAPSNLTVPVDSKVTWDWSGNNPHSVVGSWQGATVQSQQFSRSGSFEFTFATEGTFTYQCGVHGTAMAGKVNVKP